MHHRDDARLIFRAAQALFIGAPSAKLATLARVRKPTARSWRQGHRRAPLVVLRLLRHLLQMRAAECYDLCRYFDLEIARREGEPRRLTGFNEIRIREPGGIPRDGRNRLGRPKRV